MIQKDLCELINRVECYIPHPPYYYFLGSMGQRAAGISNKQVIKFFKDDHSVILVDQKGRKWCAGKRVYDDGRNNNT